MTTRASSQAAEAPTTLGQKVSWVNDLTINFGDQRGMTGQTGANPPDKTSSSETPTITVKDCLDTPDCPPEAGSLAAWISRSAKGP